MSSILTTGKGFSRLYLLWTNSIAPRSFRSSILRTRLLQSIPEDKAASSIVVLSASPQRTIVTLLNIARNKYSKSKGETKTSFMFPLLHQHVVNAVSDKIASTWFHQNDSDTDSNNERSTHVMGKFKCNNNACSKGGWASKKVTIFIRGYPRNGYNAVVFNQRCKSCNRLGTLTLDEKSYVDRVAYRLKKWAGVPMEPQDHAPKGGPPHESNFCEGCKKGVCGQANDLEHY
jgi:hypothetical protein